MDIVKIMYLSCFLVLFHGVKKCGDLDMPVQQSTQIRIINNTPHKLTYISLFSMKFPDLDPNDTSEYKVLNYNYLKDDDMIYCMQGDKKLGRYVELPDSSATHFSYSLDSVSNDILYVSSFVDKNKYE